MARWYCSGCALEVPYNREDNFMLSPPCPQCKKTMECQGYDQDRTEFLRKKADGCWLKLGLCIMFIIILAFGLLGLVYYAGQQSINR